MSGTAEPHRRRESLRAALRGERAHALLRAGLLMLLVGGALLLAGLGRIN